MWALANHRKPTGVLNDQIFSLVRELVLFEFRRDRVEAGVLAGFDALILDVIAVELAGGPVELAELFTGELGLHPSLGPLRRIEIVPEVDRGVDQADAGHQA